MTTHALPLSIFNQTRKDLSQTRVHLRHLVRLQGVRLLHLLAARLLADLPEHLRDAARRAAAAHEADRGVAHLDLARDVQHLKWQHMSSLCPPTALP